MRNKKAEWGQRMEAGFQRDMRKSERREWGLTFFLSVESLVGFQSEGQKEMGEFHRDYLCVLSWIPINIH